MAEGDVEFGHVVDLTLGEPSGTELVADAAIGATTLTVDYAGDFEDVGEVVLNGATLAYTSIAYGDAETDPDIITLAAPLAAAAVVDDKVVRVSGGEPLSDWLLHVSLGDGHPVDIPIPFEQRALWSSVDTSTPVPVMVSADLERLAEVPGRTPTVDGSFVDASTLDVTSFPVEDLPPIPQTDGNAPTAATTVTSIGGIGSMFYRWTEITNNDPVTYRLHVRAGSAPTTDGTYEVAAGVGLTSAAVRKLKDGTAIVGDGTVTYHAIVTVGDADGPGPASADVTGIPAQVTTADIAVDAITANLLTANDAFIDALDATDITGQTITGGMYRTTASGMRVEVGPGETFTFPSNEVRFYTGSSQETDPARVIALAVNPGTTSEFGQLRLEAPEWTAASGSTTPPIINLNSRTHDGSGASRILMSASEFRVDATDEVAISATAGDIVLTPEIGGAVQLVGGPLLNGATMGSGGVGTGAFRDSVRSAVMGDYAAGAWTAYTPTFTAATTNPTLASFTITGRYSQRGKTVSFSIVITATAASGYGSGTYSFGLPVAARNADEIVVTAAQTGPNHGYIGRSSGGSTSVITLLLTSTDTAINPTTSGMASGTVLRISGTYEAA